MRKKQQQQHENGSRLSHIRQVGIHLGRRNAKRKKTQNDTNPSRLSKSFSVDLLATDICDLNGTQNNVDQYTEQLSC